MKDSKIRTLLKKHQLRHTQMREDILRIFIAKAAALSKQEIENNLTEADRVTVYRTLKSFEKKGLIHRTIDGTETSRYALCEDDCDVHAHQDNHAHFHCESCGNTYCLEQIPVPSFDSAAEHHVQSAYLVLKGVCRSCK